MHEAGASAQSSIQKTSFGTTCGKKLCIIRYQGLLISNIGDVQFFPHCFESLVRDCKYEMQENGQKILEYMNL